MLRVGVLFFVCEMTRARWDAFISRGGKVYDNDRVFVGRQYFKDVLVDGQSHLLIIREETELPGAQVHWKT